MATKAQNTQEESYKEFLKMANNIEETAKSYHNTTPIDEDNTQQHKFIAEIIEKWHKNLGIDKIQTLLGICLLFQSGAHLKSVSNRTIIISETKFTKTDLSLIYNGLTVTTGDKNKPTLRALARSIRDEMIKAARIFKAPGNLYKQYKDQNPTEDSDLNNDETLEIAIHCSDIQSDNKTTPDKVKIFLANRAKNRSNNKR